MSSTDEAFLVPAGPHATPKHRSSSITSGSLGGRGKWSEIHLYVFQPSLGSGIPTHDSDYPLSFTSAMLRAQLPFTMSLNQAGAS